MIKELLSPLRPDLSQEQLAMFETYYEMMADWNTRINLTTIIAPEDVVKKHFLDSFAAEPYLKAGARVADVGTGAGFPGLPLLIIRPDLKLTLMDSMEKKLFFLEAVLEKLGLSAQCVHTRAEDAGQNPRYREQFDAALTHAVSGLPVLCELTLPLVKVGGVSIAYKGDSSEELAASGHALEVLQATAERVTIASDYGVRELVIVTKHGTTPKQFPRKAGTPAKKTVIRPNGRYVQITGESLEKKTTTRKATRSGGKANAASFAAGIAGLLLAAWLIYGTVTIDPFRWGLFAEELIIALCALLALRFLCVIPLPKWVSLVTIILLPTGIVLVGALHLPEDSVAFSRALCLAASACFSLLAAQQMDNKPDGVLLTALLIGVCLPVLFVAGTRLIDELARALISAGVFMAVLAVRQKAVGLAYLAVVAFTVAGAAGLFAAFAGLGAGIGALLLSPKRKRGGWTIAAVLMAALPVAAWFAARILLPAGNPLFAQNTLFGGEFAGLIRVHLLRALALGLLLLAVRFFARREDAAVPVVLALAGCAAARLLPFAASPDVWMDAMLLCSLAGVGVAKAAR